MIWISPQLKKRNSFLAIDFLATENLSVKGLSMYHLSFLMLIWICLSPAFKGLGITFLSPQLIFLFLCTSIDFFCLSLSSPFPPQFFMRLVLPGCAVENLWSLSLMPCSFLAANRKRGWFILHGVGSSVCLCFYSCCGISGKTGEDSLSGVMEARLQRQVGNCSLGCCWWAITHRKAAREERDSITSSPPPIDAITNWSRTLQMPRSLQPSH